MMRFAAVDDEGKIVNIVYAQDLENLICNIPEGAHAVPCPDLEVVAGSWRKVGETFQPIPKEELPPELFPAPRLVPADFWRRFTQAERIAIRGSSDPQVIDMREMLSISEFVDLKDGEMVGNIQHMESLGLLGAGRGSEVLGS